MSFGGVMLAMSAVQAVSQIGQGYAQQAENKLNATLLEGKAGMIDVQKGIENTQYERLKGQTQATSMNRLAGSGLMPSGSPMAVMIDTQTQIGIDQAIGQFNLENEKRYTKAEADAQRRAGKRAVSAGYTNAFSTMLQGASNYMMYSGGAKDMGGGGTSQYGNKYGYNTPKGTFDMGSYSAIRGRAA